jgi:two-component system chemotaxis response regulator CheY
MRFILGQSLRQAGFEITEAGNGREGLECLRAGDKFDVALIDWHMPEMDGLEFVRSVRGAPEFRDLRLVIVTSETDLGLVARALEAGADEYVMKPFTDDVIRGKLELLGVVGR